MEWKLPPLTLGQTPVEVLHEYGITSYQSLDQITSSSKDKAFDAVVLTVAHREYLELEIQNLLTTKNIIYDVKGVLGEVDSKL